MLTTNRKTSVDLLNRTVILITLYCCAARFTEMFIRANGISFEGINILEEQITRSVTNSKKLVLIICTNSRNCHYHHNNQEHIFNILVFMIIHCIIFCQVKQFAKSYIVIWIADFILNCHLVCYFISKFYIQLDLNKI